MKKQFLNRKVLKTTSLICILLLLLTASMAFCLFYCFDDSTAYAAEIDFENGSLELSTEKEFLDSLDEDENADVFLTFDYEPFECSCINHDFDSVEAAQEALANHRKAQANYYSKKNQEIVEKLGIKQSGEISIEKSNYSPHVSIKYDNKKVLSNNIKNIYSLSKNRDVANISFVAPLEIKDEATISSSWVSYDYKTALNDLNLISTQGNGINVGFYESGVLNPSHENFTGRSVTRKTTSITPHANATGSIAVGNNGIATGANIFCANCIDSSTFVEDMNWFLSNDVNIINMSAEVVRETGKYTSYDAYIDYLVRFNYITFVKSSGNTGKGITCPGNGFNVITVAALDGNKDVLEDSSFKSEVGKKPTIAAPGRLSEVTKIGDVSGTSYAAPMVTGCVALLMESKPSMLFSPEMVISCLVAGAIKLPSSGEGWDSDAGAGMVNCQVANTVAEYSVSFTNGDNNVGNVIASKNLIGIRDRYLKIAVAWLVNSRTTSPTGKAVIDNVTDYNVRLKDVDGNVVATATSLDNIEYLEYFVTGGNFLEAFTVEVVQNSAKKNSYVDFGTIAAWYA